LICHVYKLATRIPGGVVALAGVGVVEVTVENINYFLDILEMRFDFK